MGRLEKQLDPQAGPLAQLACDLRELRRIAGSPTYREMSSVAKYSPSALSAAAGGAALPTEGVLAAYVAACGGDARDVDAWLERRARVLATMDRLTAGDGDPVRSAPGDAPSAAAVLSAPVKRRRRYLRHRAVGMVAAMMLGSIATIVPMAIWGAPSCLGDGQGHPVPAANCPMTPAALMPSRSTR